LKDFKRNICVYKDFFWDFYYSQTLEVQKKIDWVIGLITVLQIVPQKYLKCLSGTDGLYEIRIQVGNNIYRVFCFFDEGNLVILLSGFQKKTQKTSRKEIQKAEQLRRDYYGSKSR